MEKLIMKVSIIKSIYIKLQTALQPRYKTRVNDAHNQSVKVMYLPQ